MTSYSAFICLDADFCNERFRYYKHIIKIELKCLMYQTLIHLINIIPNYDNKLMNHNM